ncbi:unnamed protein product [Microthlaspi erraticum]|uniref:Uncharacterized protein n=1 Tax=Microthlaspi erraticum TaxID=1685480 RepID=A0A6D2KUA3_9BRAS|nr:unnamed protein product [Microthlaspi erraticum]
MSPPTFLGTHNLLSSPLIKAAFNYSSAFPFSFTVLSLPNFTLSLKLHTYKKKLVLTLFSLFLGGLWSELNHSLSETFTGENFVQLCPKMVFFRN